MSFLDSDRFLQFFKTLDPLIKPGSQHFRCIQRENGLYLNFPNQSLALDALVE